MNDPILSGKKILIVDDEQDVLETLMELLDTCLVDTAPNFETAEKFLRKNRYDAAIFDIMGVQGYDLLEISNQKNIPALMFTAHALNPDDFVRSIEGGAKAYIPKERMSDIESYVADLIRSQQEGEQRNRRWFGKLKSFFDKQFGYDWREQRKEFWQKYDWLDQEGDD